MHGKAVTRGHHGATECMDKLKLPLLPHMCWCVAKHVFSSISPYPFAVQLYLVIYFYIEPVTFTYKLYGSCSLILSSPILTATNSDIYDYILHSNRLGCPVSRVLGMLLTSSFAVAGDGVRAAESLASLARLSQRGVGPTSPRGFLEEEKAALIGTFLLYFSSLHSRTTTTASTQTCISTLYILAERG